MRRELDALSEEERAAFEREGDDAADSLAAELRGLDEPAELDRVLTARIMESVDERRLGWWRKAVDFMVAPRQLRFNVALAAPAGGIAALLLAAAWLLAPAGETRAPVAVAPAEEPVDVATDRRVAVNFELPAPEARRVTVVGDFNDWNTTATNLKDEDGDGIWTVTVGLTKGRYAYKFLVDGERWVLDPHAQAIRPDGFGGDNALLRL